MTILDSECCGPIDMENSALYHFRMKTTMTDATLTLVSRFDGVWLQGESVLPKRAWDCRAFVWEGKELLLRRANKWWDTFLGRLVWQVETADGTVLGRMVFSGCRRVSVSLPGMVGAASLMWWPFSYRKQFCLGPTCYSWGLHDALHCRNENGVSLYDLMVGACILHRCKCIRYSSDGAGSDGDDGGDGDGD